MKKLFIRENSITSCKNKKTMRNEMLKRLFVIKLRKNSIIFLILEKFVDNSQLLKLKKSVKFSQNTFPSWFHSSLNSPKYIIMKNGWKKYIYECPQCLMSLTAKKNMKNTLKTHSKAAKKSTQHALFSSILWDEIIHWTKDNTRHMDKNYEKKLHKILKS